MWWVETEAAILGAVVGAERAAGLWTPGVHLHSQPNLHLQSKSSERRCAVDALNSIGNGGARGDRSATGVRRVTEVGGTADEQVDRRAAGAGPGECPGAWPGNDRV